MKIVLAFSGGLDTSFCAVYLKEKYHADIYTVTVNTGGFSPAKLAEIERQAKRLKVKKHVTIDARKEVFDRFLAYIVKGNILRGGVYPLCVGAERVVQAEVSARVAKQIGATAVAHGSTGAGNDQVRFDVALAVLVPKIKIITPIRDLGMSRAEEADYLNKRGIPVSLSLKRYSINEGLVGTTIGGGETHDSWQEVPDDVYTKTANPSSAPKRPLYLTIDFKRGAPVALNGRRLDGVRLVEALNIAAGKYGFGRGIHVGDTILGIKGRIAFEAPGPLLLISAHRELEKLVLTKWEGFWKNQLSEFYGNFLHEGQYFDPVMRDIESFIDMSQRYVSGKVRVKLSQGRADVVGTQSPYSMMRSNSARYGEGTALWDRNDAQGFCRMASIHSMLARSARTGKIVSPKNSL